MKYQFVISQGNPALQLSAIKLIRSVKNRGHEILPIFFYQDGVVAAQLNKHIPSDELVLLNSWNDAVNELGIELRCCVTAAGKRGIICEEEAETQGLTPTMSELFSPTGLGDFAANSSTADRVIRF